MTRIDTNQWAPGQFLDDPVLHPEGQASTPLTPASGPSAALPPLPPADLPPQPVDAAAQAAGDAWSPERMLHLRSEAPTSGWRRALYRTTRGRVNLGSSRAELERRELVALAKTRVPGCARIAVASLKGGVGKTTTTLMLGHTFASVRGDRVIALDANPDAGTLAYRLRRETTATVRELLTAADDLDRYADVRAFTSQAPSRLEVLASHQDPAVSDAFGAADYRQTLAALERFYSITLTDCGTGILHDAMGAILAGADQLVVVAAPALDGGRAATYLLDWLDAHGHGRLTSGAVVAINATRPRSDVRLDQVTAAFATRCRSVVAIPWDETLYAGAETSLDELAPATRHAYLRLAAKVAAAFPAAGTTRGDTTTHPGQ